MRLNKEEPRTQIERLAALERDGTNLAVTGLLVLPTEMRHDSPRIPDYGFRLTPMFGDPDGMWEMLDPTDKRVAASSLGALMCRAQSIADQRAQQLDAQLDAQERLRESGRNDKIASLEEKVTQAQQQLDAAEAVLEFERAQLGIEQDGGQYFEGHAEGPWHAGQSSEDEQEDKPQPQQMSLFDLIDSLCGILGSTIGAEPGESEQEPEPEPEQDGEQEPLVVSGYDGADQSVASNAQPEADSSPADQFDRLLQAQFLALCGEFQSLGIRASELEVTADSESKMSSGDYHALAAIRKQRSVLRTRILRLRWLLGTEHLPFGGADALEPDDSWELSVTM